jgi:prepilin-type N-terminal cleavage/methylation domain-containing protein
MRRHGFTWFELVVAIAVIALLVAILLPSLRRGPQVSKRTLCARNLRQQVTGLAVYATDFSGSQFPIGKKLTSLCQQELETRDAIAGAVGGVSGKDAAAVRKCFYCPGNDAQDPAKLWDTGGVSTWGYVWLNDRGAAGAKLPTTCPEWPAPTRTLPPKYLMSFERLRTPNSVMVALDVVVTDTDAAPLNYTPKGAAVDFGSSHMAAGKPGWVNVLYADEHVESVVFDAKKAVAVQQPGGGYFWFFGN